MNSRKIPNCLKCKDRDFPGRPAVKTPCFHCRGHKFDPWSRELRSRVTHGVAKKIIIKIK